MAIFGPFFRPPKNPIFDHFLMFLTLRENVVMYKTFYSSSSLLIRCNTSTKTFSSLGKNFRRAALTLLRRNHAARVAARASLRDDYIF
jgi:hypothetical protein